MKCALETSKPSRHRDSFEFPAQFIPKQFDELRAYQGPPGPCIKHGQFLR